MTAWVSPPPGNLLNNGQPWRRGDQVSIPLVLSTSIIESLEMSGGELPPGLFYNSGTRTIQGTIGALPKDVPEYPVVFRVTLGGGRKYDRSFRWIVDTTDEEQQWSTPGGVQNLGTVTRGSSVTIQLDIVNPDQDQLTYKAVGYKGPDGSHQGLPNGLTVDEFGRIIGSPTITGNEAGDYYFRVYARDPDGLLSNPRGEGSPRTSEKIYVITIGQDIVLDPRLSDVVRWETPAGSLGSCYETYPSYFGVKAVPQYELSQLNTSETQSVRYSLTPMSKPLPNGLMLDPATGLITGRCPYVTVSKNYEFTVEARVVFVHNETGAVRLSSIAGERTFSITVRSIFAADGLTSIQFNVPGPVREKLVRWVWGNQAETRTIHEPEIFSRSQVYRRTDPFFGRKTEFRILLINGLSYTTGDFIERLKDYHHPTNLRIGQVATAKARTPEGQHIYDVIYLGILDPMEGAGGFNAFGQEESLTRYRTGQKQTAIPQWNLTKDNPSYYPSSIKNMRADLLNRENRLAGQQGYGVSGREGLPLWMMSEQDAGKPATILGYQCAIELAHVRAGSGPAIVKALVTAGINEAFQGTTIRVDRYLLLSDGTASTTFDGGEFGFQEITTFDGPDNQLTPTVSYTTFDTSLQSESKYYKFPPGDR